MAWNGSSNTSAPAPKKPVPKAPSLSHGLIALIVVVVVGGGALIVWLFGGSKEQKTTARAGKPSAISEVAPSPLTNATATARSATAPEKPHVMTNEERLMEGRDTNLWKYVKNPLTGEEYVSRVFRPTAKWETKPLYKNQALNEIDGIMFSDMADDLLGVTIDKRFMANLTQAFIDGVEKSPDDDEETAARRAAMAETLDDLRAALKRGEDVETIIKDALHEHRRTAAFKDQMKEERRIMRDNGASEQEIEEFEDACNKVLEEKGASPMITRRAAQERFNEYLNKKKGTQK